jgi:ABC-2 type transport system ATP-binding protein
VTRRFGDHQALHPLDLEVTPGVTGLLGPNGSGKSTFMRCLVGLVRPDAGEVTIDGVPLAGDGVAVRRRVTYAPGELALYGELTGEQHLGFLVRGRDRGALGRARAVAQELGLPLNRRVRGYSHGMKRQLLFAAAMGPEVPVRILDEPTEGLDPTKRAAVLEILGRDAAAGRTILLSSHHLGEVDAACERIAFLDAGRLVALEESAAVHERMARLVRVWWDGGLPARAVELLDGLDGAQARQEDEHLAVTLPSGDPRGFLAALAAAELPAPSAVEHGRISLNVLYREIYGVEGV